MSRLFLAFSVIAVTGCAEHALVCGGRDADQPDAAACDPASGALATRRFATEREVARVLCERTDPGSVEACVVRAGLPSPELERCLVGGLSCRPEIAGALECYAATQDALIACLGSAADDTAVAECTKARARDAAACGVPTVTGCEALATVRYERVAVRTDYDGAVAACRNRGGQLATEHGPGSLSAIVAACSVGLPTDRTMCWTAIPADREGAALVFLVGPFQPVLAAEDPDQVIEAPQGHFAVCELP